MAMTESHTASWGILSGDETVQGITGIVTGVDLTTSQVAADEHNEIGRVIGHVVYDTTVSGRVSMIVSGAGLKAAREYLNATSGSVALKTLTMAGGTYNVSSVEIAESNSDFMKVNLSVEGWCQGNVAIPCNDLSA